MNKKLPLIFLFIMGIIITYYIAHPKEILYEAKWDDANTLAITIDGEISTTFPTTNEFTATVTCTAGTGSISWNGTKWVLTANGITKGSTKCNATFNKLRALAETILADNEIKAPLTTPGTEVSAYKESDITTTYSSNVSSSETYYYVTYGTGWEANGTKFNLTGTAVTTDTYANSYSSLVGKYLPTDSITGSGSTTSGETALTTGRNYVVYIVSAAEDSFTYKIIGSNKNQREALLASAEDDYGTSYYFRGSVTNNYVEFANKCWRIVRIGGDSTVKLILHNDNTDGVTNPCSSANNSNTAAFASYSSILSINLHTSAFNSDKNDKAADNTYVGFMYGSPNATTYEEAHANTNKSTILTNLETWYNNNLKAYESVIDDNVFCNDKSLASGLGYAKNETKYGATQRLVSSTGRPGGTGPSLKCNGELSKITNKIGLITADELAYAGYAAGVSGSESYLQENAHSSWWSLSPSDFYESGTVASVWDIEKGGNLKDAGAYYGLNSIRPVISLKSSVIVTGKGTTDNPYKLVS